MYPFPLTLAILVVGSQALQPPVGTGIDDGVIAKVRSNLLTVATHSWERGVMVEALSELDSPDLSVFSGQQLPPPPGLRLSPTTSKVMAIANQTVTALTPRSTTLFDNDGAVGDPASLGVAVLLANWTQHSSNNVFLKAAQKQLNFLIDKAPRSSRGAISHRSEQVQLWADFVYMAPPFIAYYGALNGGEYGRSLMQEAYIQCSLYRDALRDSSGLWKHIVLGDWQDNTHWGTGNAWAAAGMLRVLETLAASPQSATFSSQQRNLTAWVNEILTSAWRYQSRNGTLNNVIDNPGSFADTASTALLASVTYRMAKLTGDSSKVQFADKALALISQSIDSNGWLTQTVDPYTFKTPMAPGKHSPEGQAFVLLLHAAWRDYTA